MESKANTGRKKTAIAEYYADTGNWPAQGNLALIPYTDSNGDVLWRCGTATMPASATSSGGTGSNTVPAQYLPTSGHS